MAPPRGEATLLAYMRSVESVIIYMRANIDAPLSVEKLADRGNFSPFHFSRIFRETTGLPPGRFLVAIRLQEAKRLLATSLRTVTQVCHDIGYTSVPTFTRRFGREVGIPPQLFRRACDTRVSVGPRRRLVTETGGRRLLGRVVRTEDRPGTVLIGAFAEPLAAAWPLACAVADGDGSFSLVVSPGVSFHLLALDLSNFGPVELLLLGEDDYRIGRAKDLPMVAEQEIVIRMRAPRPVDPPVITAVPALLLIPE